jgi:hypothetical protein
MKTDRNTLYDAMYQYLVDHVFIHNGKKVVSFTLPAKENFRKKILAREKGYKRQDLETLDVTFGDLIKDIKKEANKKLQVYQSKQSQHAKRMSYLQKHGSLRIRTMIRLRNWLTGKINN